jgi:hypothetical protein
VSHLSETCEATISRCRRGHVAVSTLRAQFVVDNGSDGFDLHQLDTGAFIRTLSTGLPTWRQPKQVTFVDNSQLVVAGSDHGAIYVFDRKTGARLEVLRHSKDGLVQTVAVRRPLQT